MNMTCFWKAQKLSHPFSSGPKAQQVTQLNERNLKCPPGFLSAASFFRKGRAFVSLTLALIHISYYTILGFIARIHIHHGASWFLLKSFSPLASGLRLLKPCSAKCDDSKDTLVSENIILDAETLKRDLDNAIAEENYAKAAEIRDRLRLLQQDSLTSVLAANSQFYESFRIGDLAAMQFRWAKRDEVCCVHPGARGIYGYDDVMTSWDYVRANYEFPLQIELKDVNANVRGDMGFVSCVELVKTKGSSWGGQFVTHQFVTNVFERIDGQWFISVHHASPIDL